MLTQKNIDDLVEVAYRRINSIPDAEDIVFSIIQDLVEMGIKNINFAMVCGRIYFKYLVTHVRPYRYEYNKQVYFYGFVPLDSVEEIPTYINELQLDCFKFIHGIKDSLRPKEYDAILKLAKDEQLTRNEYCSVLRARQRFTLGLKDIL